MLADGFAKIIDEPQRAAYRSVPDPGAIEPSVETRVKYISERDHARDSISRAIAGKWQDRQGRGRLAYEAMMKHVGVSTPFQFVLSFIKTAEPSFAPANQDATRAQKEMAEFLNWQISRLGSTGEARDGWTKLVGGLIGNAYEFGFGLAELGIQVEKWQGKPMKQVREIRVLPQASLDHGFVPREEFNDLNAVDPRYRCFDIDNHGKISAVHQFRLGSFPTLANGVAQMPETEKENIVTWKGSDLLRVLHFTRNGGDGNPFGESILDSAFMPWSDLYVRERDEQVFLDANGQPYLTAVQETKDGIPNPNFSDQVKVIVTDRSAHRLLTATNAKFGSVTASNPDYSTHVDMVVKRNQAYIWQAILAPQAAFRGDANDAADTREVIQVFTKFLLPAVFKEIEEFFTWQFGKRLIDANYSNVDITDYPRFKLRLHNDNDLRVAVPMLQQLLPYLDSARLGEAAEALVPGVRRDWFPSSHENSVEVQRPVEKNDDPFGGDSKQSPPDRTGSPGADTHGDGSKVTTGQKTSTGA